MVSQAELISRSNHSLVPGIVSIFKEGMGPFNAQLCLQYKRLIFYLKFYQDYLSQMAKILDRNR